MKPISSFFSKKGISSEESKPQMTSNYRVPIQTTQVITLKEEPETQGTVDYQSFTDKSNKDSKSNVSMLTCEGATHFQSKRDYEKFSAEEKPSYDVTDKPHATPVRKKGNLGGAGDKQKTLLSYFGKG